MPGDVTQPAISSVASVGTAVTALNAEVEEMIALEKSAVVTTDDWTAALEKAGAAGRARVPAEQTVGQATGVELANLREIAAVRAEIYQQTLAQAAAEERVAKAQAAYTKGGGAVAQETQAQRYKRYATETAELQALVNSQRAARSAQWDATWGGGGGGGGGGRPPAPPGGGEPPPEPRFTAQDVAGNRPLSISERDLAAAYQLEQANLASLNTTMTRHGYLSSEAISAAARGELTYKEWGSQILGTAAKFGAWTAVSIPIFGALGAFRQMYEGAVQTSQGIAFMQRSIDNLNTSKATQEIAQLASHFNLPVQDVATAIGTMGRIFHNQTDATNAAAASLYAVKLGEVDVSQATTELTAIVNAFKLPASDLQSVFDQINQAQLRFGTRIQDSMNALATAGGVWRSAGGDLTTLLDLFVTANRVTFVSGSQFGTSLAQSINMVNQPKYVQALGTFGLVERNNNYAQLLSDAMRYVDKNPDEASAVARAFGSARQTRSLNAIFSNPDLRAQVEASVNPTAAKGASESELQKFLAGAGQQIARIGVELQLLGNALSNSGMLTGFGLLLHLVNDLLGDLNQMLGVFNELPKPLREGLSLMVEFAIAQKAARAVNLGQGLSEGNILRGVFTPSTQSVASKELRQQAIAQAEMEATDARNAAARSRTLAKQAGVAQGRYNTTYSLFTGGAAPGSLSDDQFFERTGGDSEEGQQRRAIIARQQKIAESMSTQAVDAAETSVLMQESNGEAQAFALAMRRAKTYTERLDIAIKEYGDELTAMMVSGLPMGGGAVNRIGLGRTAAGESSAAAAAAVKVDLASVAGSKTTAGIGSAVRTQAVQDAAAQEAQMGRFSAMLAGSGLVSTLGRGTSTLREGLPAAGMAALFASMVPSLLGGLLPGKLGSTVSGLGAGTAIGAGIGTFFGNPWIGGLVGAGAQDLLQTLGTGIPLTPGQRSLVAGGSPGTTKGFADQVAAAREWLKNGPPAGSGLVNTLTTPGRWIDNTLFGGPSDQAAKITLGTERFVQQRQQQAIEDHKPIPFIDAGVIVQHASQAIMQAKTHGDALKELDIALAQIAVSWQAMTGHVHIAREAAKEVRQAMLSRVSVDTASPEQFAKFYAEIGVTGQKAYNQFLVDQIARTGVTNTDVTHAVDMIGTNSKQAGYWEKQSEAKGITVTDRQKFLSYADAQAGEAQKTTQAVLDGVSKDLQQSLARATNPDQINAAYKHAIDQLKELSKKSPKQAEAAMRTDEQQWASATQAVMDARLAVRTATNTDPIAGAIATIDEISQIVQQDIKAYGADSATTLNEIAKKRAEQATLLNNQVTRIQEQGALGVAQAGNNRVLGDTRALATAQEVLDKLRSNPRSSPDQLLQAQTTVADARNALLNDTTQQANDLSNAYQTYLGNRNGDPLEAANHAVTAAKDVLKEGNFKTRADYYNALNNLNTTRQSRYSAEYQNLQTTASLEQLSSSQMIGIYANFVKTIKGDTALKRQVMSDILNLEKGNEGQFELNVGNIHLPSLYGVRRAELRRSGKNTADWHNYVNIAVTVNDSGNAKTVGREVAQQVHRATKTALKNAQRSSNQR